MVLKINTREIVRELLLNFRTEIEKARSVRNALRGASLQTLCEQMAEMRKEDAYMHLYGEVWNYHSFFDTSCTHTITDYYDQPADPIYQQWCSEEREVIIREAKIIPLPKNDETLGGYLSYLVSEVSEGNEHRYIWIKSLRSFLQFLRDDMPFDQKGYLERLFPSDQGCKGMKFQKETHYSPKGKKIQSIKCQVILRRVEKTIYPIDIFTTAEILKNLIAAILEGRPNGQHSAAEALGFAWLSIFVGRLRIMTQEQMVFATKRSGFKNLKTNPTADLFSPTRFITVDTLDGAIDVPVSKMVYEFLSALSCDSESDTIFQLKWEDVLRTFRNKGVNPLKSIHNIQNVTFLTLMSYPHEVFGHRYSAGKTATH